MAKRYLEDNETKIVDMFATVPVTNLDVPFIGEAKEMLVTIKNIRECLHAGARVQEHVGNKLLPLGFNNYNTDNTIVTEDEDAEPVVKTVVTETAVADAQAAQEAAILAQEAKKEEPQATPTAEPAKEAEVKEEATQTAEAGTTEATEEDKK